DDRWVYLTSYLDDDDGFHSMYYDKNTIDKTYTKYTVFVKDVFPENDILVDGKKIEYILTKYFFYCGDRALGREYVVVYFTDNSTDRQVYNETKDVLPDTVGEEMY